MYASVLPWRIEGGVAGQGDQPHGPATGLRVDVYMARKGSCAQGIQGGLWPPWPDARFPQMPFVAEVLLNKNNSYLIAIAL